MAMQMVTFDDKDLQEGKFYLIAVNKDQANATLKLPPPVADISFENATYIRAPYTPPYSYEIWKVEKYGSEERHTNITSAVENWIEKPSNHIVINSNQAITGYIKFIKFI